MNFYGLTETGRRGNVVFVTYALILHRFEAPIPVMSPSLSLILRLPALRVSAIAIFFFGLCSATTVPYLSIIGIHELGLSNTRYSFLIFMASCVNVATSIVMGILADRCGQFRGAMIVISLFGVAGYGMVFLFPQAEIFVSAVIFMVPVYGALNSLIFANIRAACDELTVRELIGVNSTVRAVISASWVLVPGLVGFALAGRTSMLPAFLIACLGAAICCVLFLFALPKADTVRNRPSRLSFIASLRQVSRPWLLKRVVAIALISAMMHISGIVLPLVITGPAGAGPSDVGIIVGLIAFLEIPFILLWGTLERHSSSVHVLVLGGLVYCVYLCLLGYARAPWHVYALTPVAGLGAGAIISIPISYLQNLLADRPGLGSSLIAINIFASAGFGSLLFAAGTSLSTYSGTALLAAFAGLCGIAALIYLEKPQHLRFGGRHRAGHDP
ncbi:MFS transporter [Allorhizobium undicola]|uniref:MFS transporter n=1 Tax=Allorhizobium undicola TaxID=78527 RepID=UPI000AE15523|nr:MFS transporter [Allorhizobium undicola]